MNWHMAGWTLDLKSQQHIRLSQCRGVWPKLVQAGNRKGLKSLISASLWQASTEGNDKARGKDQTSEQREREREDAHLSSCHVFIFLLSVKSEVISPLCSLNHTQNLFTSPTGPGGSLREEAVSLQQAAPVYLQSRKPVVPSGPVGWRITWLFGQTVSKGCCTLIRAVLQTEEIRNKQCLCILYSQFDSLRLTYPGLDCPEAFLLKMHCPKSFFGLLHILPLFGPKTSSVERGERMQSFLWYHYWKDVLKFESEAEGLQADSHLGLQWQSAQENQWTSKWTSCKDRKRKQLYH